MEIGSVKIEIRTRRCAQRRPSLIGLRILGRVARTRNQTGIDQRRRPAAVLSRRLLFTSHVVTSLQQFRPPEVEPHWVASRPRSWAEMPSSFLGRDKCGDRRRPTRPAGAASVYDLAAVDHAGYPGSCRDSIGFDGPPCARWQASKGRTLPPTGLFNLAEVSACGIPF